MQNTYIYSVYAPPGDNQEEFEALLDNLAVELRGQRSVIVAGDFNAWALEWGSRLTNRRGDALLDAFESLDLVLTNRGTTPTFKRNGNCSIIDLTFISESLAPRIRSWQLNDAFTSSDHQIIIFETGSSREEFSESTRPIGWNSKSFDREAFIVMMEKNLVLSGFSEVQALQLMSLITKVCDASMTRREKGNHHSSVYWWDDEIAKLRKACHRTRRRA